MGLYVEPKEEGTKLYWCLKHGQDVVGHAAFGSYPAGTLPVAFLDNGAFQAVAIAFSPQEFRRLYEGRPDAKWFAIDKVILRKHTPGGEHIKELK